MEKRDQIMATGKVYYPEYWAKRRDRLNPKLVEELEKSAESDVEFVDEYGEYRVGTFLFRNAIVTVRRDAKAGWSLHIFSEFNIGLPLIREVRYKFIPDQAAMVQLFASREEDKEMQGVMLYEIPRLEAEESEA